MQSNASDSSFKNSKPCKKSANQRESKVVLRVKIVKFVIVACSVFIKLCVTVRVRYSSLVFVTVRYCQLLLTFLCNNLLCLEALMICSKNSVSGANITHLLGFSFKFAATSRSNTCSRRSMHSR